MSQAILCPATDVGVALLGVIVVAGLLVLCQRRQRRDVIPYGNCAFLTAGAYGSVILGMPIVLAMILYNAYVVMLGCLTMAVPDQTSYERRHTVFAELAEDAEGFAYVTGVTPTRPSGDAYVQTRVQGVYSGSAHLDLPFSRYYLDEKAAPEAERVYWRHARGPKRDAYITVCVRGGQAVLEELYIAGQPGLDFLRSKALQRERK